jgi:hypothetical protein
MAIARRRTLLDFLISLIELQSGVLWWNAESNNAEIRIIFVRASRIILCDSAVRASNETLRSSKKSPCQL